ncbi:hypothetical protein [Dysgonomonas sp. ZJ279]|uniref:hypothetical protein n=1 Tax=Dysgonomonas sp. ZJ279 TaxID=2709796 RepID=UPI0013EA6A33|nr:hypothetical protein [Dysgonomonas sp. ZJ279]
MINIHERVSNIWKRFELSIHDSILERGFMYSENTDQKDILITGINPSWRTNDDKKEIYSFNFKDILGNNKWDNYWSSLKKILKSELSDLDYTNNAAYLDIFHFREMNQKFLTNVILKSNDGRSFLAEQLNLTQHIIEDIIKPKVIIVKNKESATYWGRWSENGIIWMGYKFQPIPQFNSKCGEAFKITGLLNSDERISPEIKETNLIGTIVLFTKHINQYTKKDERPNAEILHELLSYTID